MADLSALAPYANNPDVVAYLKYLQANQAVNSAVPPNLDAPAATPFDAALTSADNAAQATYDNTLATLDAQYAPLRGEFGFTDTGAVDPNNPFGKAQLLQRAYQQNQKGNKNSYAARGQLYSGALQNAQNNAQFNNQAQSAALRQQYENALAQIAGQKATAASNFANTKAGNYWQWVQQQIANRDAGYPTSAATDGAMAPPAQGYAPAPNPILQNAAQTGGVAAPYQPPAPSGTFQSYANDPAVVAYLKALQAKQQQINHVGLTPLQLIPGRGAGNTGGVRA
jgi:hypothetical protein